MRDIIVKANQNITLPILWSGKEQEIDLNIRLAGNGASLTLLALLIGKKNHKLRLKTTLIHEKPNTNSRIIIRGALKEKAFVDFDGLVKIEKGAKNTNAWLGAHLLLLSDTARGRAVPSLEILENDIKAGHAATVGKINDLEMFYLRSRGLSKKTAESLIVNGFLNSIISAFPSSLAGKAEKAIASF